MSDKVIFYYNPMSRGRIVHWMLEEVGAPYDVKMLHWEKGDHKSPDYLKINPMGKIPSIVHRGVVVTQTPAICAYLADAFPQAKLAPAPTDPQRGAYYRWLFFAAACIEPAFLDKTNPRTGDPKASHMGHGSYEDVVRVLEQAVSKGFLVNGQFTAADVYLASSLEWGLLAKTLDAHPAFTRYIGLCHDRPAFRRFQELAGPIKA